MGTVTAAPPPAGAGPAEPGLARSTLVMVGGTALSRATGLLRVVVLAGALGVAESRVADTYNLANTTPNILYQLVLGGILSATFVPVFVEVRQRQGREAAWQVGRSVLTIALAVLGGLALAGMAAAPWIMRLYTLGVQDGAVRAAQQRAGAALLVMFLPQVVFYGVGAIMSGLLQAERRFGVPAFAPVLNNLVVAATGVAFAALVGGRALQLGALDGGELLLLGLGTTGGVAAMVAVQVPVLRRVGFRYRPAWDLRHPAIRKMARLSAYTAGFVAASQLAALAVPVLANRVQGGYTAFSIAFLLFQLPHGIFAVSLMTALLPPLSEHAAAGEWDAFRAALSRAITATAAVLLPASAAYTVLARPVVRLLLEHGVVGRGSVGLLAGVLVALAVGLLPFSLFQLGLRAWYAMQDTRTPLLVNLVVAAVDVGVAVVLVQVLPSGGAKVAGLGVANSLAYGAGTLLLLGGLRRRLGRLDGARIAGALARVAAASLAMAGLTALVASGLGNVAPPGLGGELLVAGGSLAVGVAGYLLAAWLLGVRELAALLAAARRRRPAAATPKAGR
jgi:putative peptidoglycan lipid II flippase